MCGNLGKTTQFHRNKIFNSQKGKIKNWCDSSVQFLNISLQLLKVVLCILHAQHMLECMHDSLRHVSNETMDGGSRRSGKMLQVIFLIYGKKHKIYELKIVISQGWL